MQLVFIFSGESGKWKIGDNEVHVNGGQHRNQRLYQTHERPLEW